MKPQTLTAALLLALLPGCFFARNQTNESLRPERLEMLEPGRTTAEDAAAALGAPAEVVQLGYRSAWRYEHVVEKRQGLFLIVFGMMNSDTRSDRAWLFFDEQGVLSHVGTTLAADRTEFTNPWSEQGE